MKREKLRYSVFDVEANGLLGTVSEIHCLSYATYEEYKLVGKGSFTEREDIIHFLENEEVLVAHNGIRYDIPAVNKVYGVDIKTKVYDTLALSWYLYPHNGKHGLEIWGEYFGVLKPVIEQDEWLGPLPDETQEEFIKKMLNRCEEDVKINSLLMHKMLRYLYKIYEDVSINNILNYLMFKMYCLKEQEENPFTLDKRKAEKYKLDLGFNIEERKMKIGNAMPRELGTVVKNRPSVMYKKDGTLSAHGTRWLALLKDMNLPKETETIRETPNVNSHHQLKKWLVDLGWDPAILTISKSTGNEVPQVSLPGGHGLCPSVKLLYKIEPRLELLDGLYKTSHRLGVVKSFLNNEVDGKVEASAQGLTNTLRFRHRKPCVNLPKPRIYFGNEIRGLLQVPDDTYTMIGSDISSLEDKTKMHYMYFFDPDYVNDLSVPGFDGHLDIALFAGLMTQDEVDTYKKFDALPDELKASAPKGEKDEYHRLSGIRANAKTINFGGVYGIGPPKLAKQLGCTLKEAKKLHQAYWERNKAVLAVTKNLVTKEVDNQKWLYNPVSRFWYFLKEDKDKFSTLNQGTGVFVFDSWVKNCRKAGMVISGQFHDELINMDKNENIEGNKKILIESIEKVNKALNLNVTIGISTEVGKNYSEVH